MPNLRLPNFIVAGAPKSGTTSLYYYLIQHPYVFLPKRKELHFFSYAYLKKNSNGPGDRKALSSLCKNRTEYEKHYLTIKDEVAIGEISPSYLYYSDTSRRINHELEGVKIILMLRDPVERAYSQFMHQAKNSMEILSFEKALKVEKQRISKNWSDMWRYAESSLYYDRVCRFFDEFGMERVKVIIFEDFISNPKLVLSNILSYLDVDPKIKINTTKIYNQNSVPRSRIINLLHNRANPINFFLRQFLPEDIRTRVSLEIKRLNTGKKITMMNSTRRRLEEYFFIDVQKLEKKLGRRLPWSPSKKKLI